jgi:hypothetical protein
VVEVISNEFNEEHEVHYLVKPITEFVRGVKRTLDIDGALSKRGYRLFLNTYILKIPDHLRVREDLVVEEIKIIPAEVIRAYISLLLMDFPNNGQEAG